jgi:hypothetical protein
VAGLGDDVGRRDQRHGAGRGGGAEARADLPLGIGGQQVAVHVARPAAHRVARHDVLGDRRLEEALRRIDLDVARSHVGLVDHAPDTAVMVDVAVGVDHGLDRLLAPIRVVQVEPDLGRLRRDQRVDDGDPLVALDDHIRQV